MVSSHFPKIQFYYLLNSKIAENIKFNLGKEEDFQELDEESGPKQELKESDITSNLFIYNQLVIKMGFSSDMVKKILIYDKDIINDDVQAAVDLLIKTENGWIHTFIQDTEFKTFNDPDQMFITDDSNEICLVCGESKDQHRKTLRNISLSDSIPSLPLNSPNILESNSMSKNEKSELSASIPVENENNFLCLI